MVMSERRSLILWLTLLLTYPMISLAAAQEPEGRLLFKIEPGKSRAGFEAKTFLFRFQGTTDQVTGWVRVANLQEPQTAEASVEIDVRSLKTGVGRRDRDMMRFFEVEKYPKITFTLKEVQEAVEDEQGFRFTLLGDLTLHGITQAVAIPAQATVLNGKVWVEGKVDLKMSDFDIKRPRVPFFPLIVVQDKIAVSFKILAVQEGQGP